MQTTAHPMRYALADLAVALTQVSAQQEAVCRTVARAAADMVGEGAGVQLLRDDGRYDALAFHHRDPQRIPGLIRALDRGDELPGDELSTTLAANRQPIVLPADRLTALLGPQHTDVAASAAATGDPAGPGAVERPPGITAALLCPVVVDDEFLGYLVLTRTTPGASYSAADVDLARDITGELVLALITTRSLERLRASEERYRRVLETIPEGVLQLDPDGMITYANEPIGVVLGMPREQLTGLPLRGFLDGRGQTELSRRLTDARTGRATVGGTKLLRADGSQRTVRISMMPLPDDHGRPGGSLCMISDITDHIDARGLKRQLDHLRRLDSLGQLIGGISHDFNNLLTVVAGSAEMIAADARPDSAEHQLATDILQATAKGRSLTHQLLAFGRADGARPEVIAVPDLLTDMQSMFSRTLGEHISLDVSFGPDVWPVRAERGPLEQAMVNLAANAREAMLHGGVLRVVAGNQTVEPGEIPGTALAGRVVHIEISDTGVGMSDETRRRAFEPFFTTRPTAAGLGLATAAAIVRGIGGQISLDSEPRMGTTVHLYLPAAADPSGPAADRSTAPVTVRNVLIVEDQPDVAQLVQRLVEPAGYTVTVSTDARTAVAEVADGADVDLLITDVVMPSMTGPELAAALREHRPGLPVIYMSGYTAAALGPQIQLDDNSTLVEKPFNRSTLLGAIRALAGAPPAAAG